MDLTTYPRRVHNSPHMAPLERDRSLRVRVSDEEQEMLQALADRRGVTVSDYIRLTAREAYRAEFGDKPPKKTKK